MAILSTLFDREENSIGFVRSNTGLDEEGGIQTNDKKLLNGLDYFKEYAPMLEDFLCSRSYHL